MLLVIIVLLGAFSYRGLGLELMPEMNFPVAAVATSYQGAGPQEVENLVTRPLEEVLITVNNVDNVQSQSQENASIVIVQFDWGTDIDDVMLDLREAIDRVRPNLPDDADTPRVLKFDPNMFPMMSLSLAGDSGAEDLRRIAEEIVQPRLERIEGVASAGIQGGTQREILIEALPEQLNAYGLSMDSLVQALRASNLTFPGGKVETGSHNFMVRTEAEFDEVDDIRRLPLMTPDGQMVRLSDVAKVTDGFKEQTTLTRVNGQAGVALNIVKETGANTVQVSERVQREMKEIQEDLPAGYQISKIYDNADFIVDSINNLTQTAIMGGLLAVLVLYVFLRHLRSTLVVALSIPISIIATFMLIRYGGLTLNLISLGGLGLGIGMLVDNSIVVLENIFRHRQLGKDPQEAAIYGANEVGAAITSSTLTTIAVFLPVVLVEGLMAELFGQMSWTVTYSLVASLLVALTAVPLFASRMTKGNLIAVKIDADSRPTTASNSKLMVTYRRMIRWSLRRRGWVLAGVMLVVIGTLAMTATLKAEFMPATDQGMVMISAELETGSNLQATDKVMQQVEEIITALPEVETSFVTIGGGSEGQFLGVSESHRAEAILTLTPMEERERSASEVAEMLREQLQRIPGAKFTVSDDTMGAGMMSGSPISITLMGSDLEQLKLLSDEVASKIRSVPGIRNVETSLGQGIPELQVQVDEGKAFQYGLTSAQIAQYINQSFNGQVATRYRVDGEEIDVRVRLRNAADARPEDLLNLMIPTRQGGLIPLRDVASISEASGPVTISRSDQERAVMVTADIGAGYALGEVTVEVQKILAEQRMPAGYSLKYGGEQQDMVEAFGDLGLALVLAVLLVYMIMAAQFESFLYPLGIMAAFPISVVGGLLGLIVTGRAFSVVAFIGLIMLAGIIVNNGIVLVDYINLLRRNGMERNDAIVEAGETRLRPILMTTLTTVLGLSPLALGIGEGSEIQAPLATVVLSGLTLGTLLTLIVVPVFYSYLDDLGRLFQPREKRARRTWFHWVTRLRTVRERTSEGS